MPIPDELRNQIAAQIMQSIFMPAQQPNFGELSLKRQAQAEENQYRQDALELTRRHTEFEEGQIPIARQAEADRQTQTLMMQKTLAEIAANTARYQTDVPVAAREPERIFMAGESEKDRIAADALAARQALAKLDEIAALGENAVILEGKAQVGRKEIAGIQSSDIRYGIDVPTAYRQQRDPVEDQLKKDLAAQAIAGELDVEDRRQTGALKQEEQAGSRAERMATAVNRITEALGLSAEARRWEGLGQEEDKTYLADTLERDRMALAKEEAAAERDLKALLAKNALTSEERLLAKKLAAELEIANIDAILPKAQAKALEGEDLRLAAVKQAEIEKQTMMAPGIARELIEGAEPWAITRVFDQIMGGDTRGKFLRDLQEAIPGALDKAPKAALLPVINAELERRYGERYKRARDENKSAYSFLEQ